MPDYKIEKFISISGNLADVFVFNGASSILYVVKSLFAHYRVDNIQPYNEGALIELLDPDGNKKLVKIVRVRKDTE